MQDVRAAAMPRSRLCTKPFFARVPLAIAAATLLTGLFSSASVSAQERYPWEDYDKRVKASQAVSPLGPDLLGDNVSLSNGALSFSATDVSIPGNNALRVEFTRTYSVSDRKDTRTDEMLADWAVDLPNISGTFAPNWITKSSTTNRCSDTQAPPMPSSAHFLTEFWHGIHLNIPGRGSNELLVTNPGTPTSPDPGGDPGDGGGGGGGLPGGPGDDDPQRIQRNGKTQRMTTASTMSVSPPTDGATYRWATNDHVQVSCLPSIKNGTGEGFLAVAPDGTRYWFDWMAQNFVPTLESPNATQGISVTNLTPRRKNVLYATRVEDRFGNWVTYTYSNTWNQPGKLTKIASSDGRQITVGYGTNGFVSSVSDGSRNWQYAYAGANAGRTTLIRVTQPDSSKWTINFAGFTNAEIQNHEYFAPGEIYRTCTLLETPINIDAHPTASITHPSGATGTFTIGIKEHGRSNVPVSCGNVTTGVPGWGNDPNDDINTYVISYNAFTLEQKAITGPGLQPMTWTYSYAAGISKHFYPGTTRDWPVCMESYCSQPPCTSDSCAGSSITTVAGPDNTWTRYIYGNSFLYNEGKLLRVDRGSSSTAILQTTVNTYDLSQLDKAYPASFGDSLQVNGQGFTAEFHRPLTQSQVSQQGVTFTRTINTFDGFARSLTETKASSLGYSRVEGTVWHDDFDDWVIGQVAKSTVDGIVASETGFDPLARPVWSKAFGKLQHTLTYYADGTLATYKNGRNLVTTLSNWYRGVPRGIGYPDGTSESAVVNATGTIASTTDENGFTTGYAYDVMGRLARIDYPTGDSTAWNATHQAFAQVGGVEYGIPAGHWRQTVSTGNGVKIVYYDAMWRPLLTREYDAGNVAATQRFVRYAYDGNGRTAFQSYPSTGSSPTTGTWTLYDALSRPTSVSQDSELGLLTTTTTYLTGFQTRVTNPRGFQTTTSFKAFDTPSSDWPATIVHPEDARTTIHRDAFGKPLWIKRYGAVVGQPEAVRWYVYDGNQQLCKTIEPETGSTVMAYDAAGNLAWSASGQALPSTTTCDTASVAAAAKVLRTYDTRNRLDILDFSDNNGDQDWTYTPDGLPQQIITYNGPTTAVNSYVYNKRRLLTQETSAQPGWYTWNTYYGFNSNGHLASQQYPTTLYVDYAPNALGQPTRVGSYATGVSYYPNGAIKQFTYGNGIVHTMQQNARQLPVRSTDSGVFDFTFAYDGSGNTTSINDINQVSGQYSGSRDMRYDGLDRLTYAHLHWWSIDNFTYDVLDNIRGKSHYIGGVTTNHEYWYDPANRLTNVRNADTGATIVGLGYDAQGNLATKSGQAYNFDYGNRLRNATGQEYYRYDGHGRRILSWRPNGTLSLSMYSQSGQLLYQQNDSRALAIDHIYLQGSLIATSERNYSSPTAVARYQHTDALGSPVATTNETGQVINRTHYEPYGESINTTIDGVGYTGHVEDAATGLVYMQQRYYDAAIGRFLSVDPVTANSATGANFNRYWYANNNPYKYFDPDGRFGCTGSRIQRNCANMGMVWQAARRAGAALAQAIPMPRPPPPMPWNRDSEPSDDDALRRQAELLDKMADEVAKIVEKAQGPEGVQYSLRAAKDNLYPNRNTGGVSYLREGEVWKYGQTTKTNRYSAAELSRMGLVFVVEYRGGQIQIKIAEKMKIYGYRLTHDGARPPGNPIDR